ncbi:MAG: tRNA (adenosine(37)-N6)-dimethylallyltransferase MiaA [Chloroflexi bacterium]|nr:tRNA (adenosine(37)-N6)-dimethylallyltransferase MiaA [Chloroflexota bacterium]
MQFLECPSPLVILLGPTAVGKTEVAIQLALRLDGEIVSADSRLFYRGMDIGTAKPTPAQRNVVPHHLIDLVNPDEGLSLAVFQKLAQEAIGEIHARGKLPILVGGTGQYIRAVTEAWEPPALPPDLVLRRVLEGWATEIGPNELHARLMRLDPEAAQRIDARNLRRTLRAWEVILRSGRRFSEQRIRSKSDDQILQIGLSRPRAELFERADERIDTMIGDGFVDEVRGLLAQGYSPELPPLSAIGYREIVEYLMGNITLEMAVNEMKRLTHKFIRRQATWFKASDPAIHWFEMGPKTVDTIVTFICTFQYDLQEEHL